MPTVPAGRRRLSHLDRGRLEEERRSNCATPAAITVKPVSQDEIPVRGNPVRADRMPEIVALLQQATGEDEGWTAQISETTRLDGDLWLDSVELTALHELLRDRYGDHVDLLGFLTGLGLDEIDRLTVHDLVTLVEQP